MICCLSESGSSWKWALASAQAQEHIWARAPGHLLLPGLGVMSTDGQVPQAKPGALMDFYEPHGKAGVPEGRSRARRCP